MTPLPPKAKLDVSASTPTGSGRQPSRGQAGAAGTAAPSGRHGPIRDRGSAGARGRPPVGFDLELAEAVFALGAGLPVAELAVPGDPATARAAAAALWMARIWGDQPGYACLCLGHGGHLGPGGSYVFDRFTQSFHRWPANRLQLLGRAMAAAAHADVYVGVLLGVRPSRRAGSALPGRVAWADVDGPWTLQRARALGRLEGRPVWQVQSGSGRHLYLPLDELEPPERLEGWNRRLAVLLDADAGWSQTKLLRLPGTFNHKPRAAGGDRPTPVVWLP
jgi:hypothetical protein